MQIWGIFGGIEAEYPPSYGTPKMDNISRALTDVEVRKAKPAEKPYKMTDGGGLYLLVQPSGAKLWRMKFRLHGKEGLYAIGAYPDVSLAAARNEHRAAREMVAAGTNPVHARKADREQAAQAQLRAKVGEFSAVVDSWKEANNPRLAPLSIKQRDREVKNYLLSEFKGRAIERITRLDIAPMLKTVEKRVPEVARNLRNYLSAIFEHAIDLGLISANPVPPPRTIKRRASVSHAAMDMGRIPGFLAAVNASNANPETKTAMQLVLLTACRKNEVTGARWDEFDLDAAEWIIPPERMKARREHFVPLPQQAVALLRELRELSDGEFLFPHRNKPNHPMAANSLNAIMGRIGYGDAATPHGFRSVFSTHFNGLGENPDVIESCLAHARKGVRGVYNRYEYRDERRALLQKWADHLDSLAAARADTAMAA